MMVHFLKLFSNQFTLKNDGGKVRKRDSREICVKRSLTQIKKKWPKCCTSTTDSEKIPGCSHPSLVTIPEKQSQCEIDDAVASLTSKIESLVRDMSQRMDLLENGFSEFMSQANCQKIQNSATFDDFNRMKYQFTKAAQLNKLDEPLNLDFLNKMNPSNCKVKVNFSKMGGLPQETTSGDTFASDEVEDIRRDIIWLKERMAELSDSMKIQSLASKRLKREGLKKLKDQVGYLAEYFQRLKFNAIETRDGELK